MNSKKIILVFLFLILFAELSSALTLVINSSKSGFLSQKDSGVSFNSLGKDKAELVYYNSAGLRTTIKIVHYEWFNLSSIPKDSTIISALLYKYHDSSSIGTDTNNLMSPKTIAETNRVTLGKLTQSFSSDDSYSSNGYKLKSQQILTKIDKTSFSSPRDDVLEYDVTDIVKNWLNGEQNYGFSFLGNYNTGGYVSQNYYLSNSNQYNPQLVITYTLDSNTTNSSICGNKILEAGEECDDGNLINTDNCTNICKLNKCGDGFRNPLNEECDDGNLINDDGCSNLCKIENISQEIIYIVSYVGDIDGNVSESWFSFYENITNFYENSKIPVGFSFYPATIIHDVNFERIFTKMYSSDYIELIQKGYTGDELEMRMENLTFAEQKQIIQNGQNYFKQRMQEILMRPDIKLPIAYNQIHGKFTNTTKRALEELGFKMYFDVFVEGELAPVATTKDFDVFQYGVSLTDGSTGKDTNFYSPESVINQIRSYNRSDTSIIIINGSKVIPLWVHQQDFENASGEVLDMNKWNNYTYTLLKIKNDSRFRLVSLSEVYNLRHPDSGYKDICQFASSASATSEDFPGSVALYATGMPNALEQDCSIWSGSGYNWNPSNWNIIANLTLKYDALVYASNLSIYGDYDMCWNRIWLRNSKTNEEKLVMSGMNTSCFLMKNLQEDFIADQIILETCGISWSSTDAVKLCGKGVQNTTPANLSLIKICKWKNCYKGAVSVSVDDSFNACMDKLEANGYRGTYFLSNTDTHSWALWNELNEAFKKGHELGTHTLGHLCSEVNDSSYQQDIEENIAEITFYTDAERENIATHAHPCGFTTQNISKILKSNWNFISARGYYFNKLEEPSPVDFFNLKSYNSHGYPGGAFEPPSYSAQLDMAEAEEKWMNLVFHNECTDDNVISYFKTKSVWVDTIGNVARYITLRDNATIYDVNQSETQISFKIKSGKTERYYKQKLTLSVKTNKIPIRVELNKRPIPYSWSPIDKTTLFNVNFPINGSVRIVL